MATKNDRWPLFAIRHVLAHGEDIAIALRWRNAGCEHRVACGSAYYPAVLGSVLRSWTIPSRNTTSGKGHNVFFANSELQVLKHEPSAVRRIWPTISRITGKPEAEVG